MVPSTFHSLLEGTPLMCIAWQQHLPSLWHFAQVCVSVLGNATGMALLTYPNFYLNMEASSRPLNYTGCTSVADHGAYSTSSNDALHAQKWETFRMTSDTVTLPIETHFLPWSCEEPNSTDTTLQNSRQSNRTPHSTILIQHTKQRELALSGCDDDAPLL